MSLTEEQSSEVIQNIARCFGFYSASLIDTFAKCTDGRELCLYFISNDASYNPVVGEPVVVSDDPYGQDYSTLKIGLDDESMKYTAALDAIITRASKGKWVLCIDMHNNNYDYKYIVKPGTTLEELLIMYDLNYNGGQ